MSWLTDLLKRTKEIDAELGRELEQEFKALSDRRAFGLNFESHKPEMMVFRRSGEGAVYFYY